MANRRRLLAALGTAAASGLAGCGGRPNGNGTTADTRTSTRPSTGSRPAGTTSDGEPRTTETRSDASGFGDGDDLACTDLAGSYVALDPGERRPVFRSEYPRALQAAGELRYENRGSTVTATTGPLGLAASMRFQQDLHSDTTPFPERDGYEPLAETTFNGETRAAGLETEPQAQAQGIVVGGDALVSGTYDGDEQLFALRIEHEVLRPEGDADACREVLVEGLERAFASLEPNPETTVADFL